MVHIKKLLPVLLVLAVIAGGYLALHKSEDHKASQPIKIGALLCLTGLGSAWGEHAKEGIELAVAEINARGGINGRQIQIIYEDTGTDPQKTVSAFEVVTNLEHVTAIMGPLNLTEMEALLPLIKQTGIPVIAPDFVPLQDRKDLSNPILVWADGESESRSMADYMYGQGIRKVAAIGTLDAWEQTVTNAFVDRFKLLGGTVTDVEIVQQSSSDMKFPITRAVGTKPEAVYLGTYYQFVNSIQEMNDLGFKGKLYSIEVDDYLAGQTSGLSNGLQFVAPDYYSDAFIQKFTSTYGQKPGLPAGQAYDSANILFSLLQQSTNQADILKEMKNFTEYDGVSGHLTIGPDGRTHLPVSIFQIDQGKISKLEDLK